MKLLMGVLLGLSLLVGCGEDEGLTELPDGTRVTVGEQYVTLSLVIDKYAEVSVDPYDLASASMRAVLASREAWLELQSNVPLDFAEEVLVYIVPGEAFADQCRCVANLTYRDGELATMTIQDAYTEGVVLTGEPVIHEAMHILIGGNYDNFDYNHLRGDVWSTYRHPGNTPVVQTRAQEIYLEKMP